MEMRGTSIEAAPAAFQLRAEAAEREIKKPLMAKRVRMFMVESFNRDGVNWWCRAVSSGWVYYMDPCRGGQPFEYTDNDLRWSP